MPERDQYPAVTRQPGELNEGQQRHLRVSCQYIDKLLADIDDTLHAAASKSPFPRYIVDVSPAQIRVVEDYVRRIRSQLLRTIAWQNMEPEPPSIPATRAVLTNLTFIDIAIEELRANYMKGFGPVPEGAVSELNGVVHELRSLVTGMQACLKQEFGAKLEKRLQQLEKTGCDVALLRLLEQIATRNGLVEFRSRIDAITRRLEGDSFEIALFGRVSSGKSSLLNIITGAVGEQNTALDRAFRELAETPNVALDRVAEQAVLWAASHSVSEIPALQLAEWVHEAIWESVQGPIERLRSVGNHVIESLQRIASEMGRADAPAKEDFEVLLRDMPPFELATLPDAISVSHWKILGDAMVRSRIKSSLRESIGPLFKDELHHYGIALSQRGQQVVRRLEELVNSYAEAYREQIHRISDISGTAADIAQLERDLVLLMNWDSTKKLQLAEKHA